MLLAQTTTTWTSTTYDAWAENDQEPCLYVEFFKQEQSKPPWMRSSSCLIYCPCWRHRVYC